MTYYPDLTPYEYVPTQIPEGFEAFNVGWLEPEHDVPTFEGGARSVASDGRLLAAPALVLHYIRDHRYQPPEAFIEAVKAMRVAPDVSDG